MQHHRFQHQWISERICHATDRSTHESDVRLKPCLSRRRTLLRARTKQQESEFLDVWLWHSSSRNWATELAYSEHDTDTTDVKAVVTPEIKVKKTETIQFCFSVISDVITCEIKQKQNIETILKRVRTVLNCFIIIIKKPNVASVIISSSVKKMEQNYKLLSTAT